MNLTHLKTSTCPTCHSPSCLEGVEVGADGNIRQHINGQRWEFRKFPCGLMVSWIPNFNAEVQSGCCVHNQEWVARREAFRELKKNLVKTVLDFGPRTLWSEDINRVLDALNEIVPWEMR